MCLHFNEHSPKLYATTIQEEMGSPDQQALLIMDKFGGQVSKNLEENTIILVAVLAGTTDKLQPLDLSATFADDVKNLADKALPDLNENVRERLAIDRFLTQISEPQLAFSIQQKQPKTVNDAVATTLELQAHLSLANAASQPSTLPVDTVTHSSSVQPDRPMELLEQLVSQMEKLQTELSTRNHQSPSPHQQQSSRGRPGYQPCYQQPQQQVRGPFVCYRCSQEVYYARGCATPSRSQGNQVN